MFFSHSKLWLWMGGLVWTEGSASEFVGDMFTACAVCLIMKAIKNNFWMVL